MPVAEDTCQIGDLPDNSRVPTARSRPGLRPGMAALLHLVIQQVIACLLFMAVSSPLFAQGLGDEVILSRLGDPVELEIALNDWQQLEMSKVKVVNATREQYESFKLTYLPLLDFLNFNVVGPSLAGEVKILVSSRTPVAEPYLDLLLVMKWPAGSSMREYVLLFDPPLPNFKGAGEAGQSSKAAVTTPPASQADQPPAAIAAADPAPQVQPKPQPARPAVASKVETTAGLDAETKLKAPAAAKTAQPDVRTQTAIEVEKVSAAVTTPANDGRRQYRVRIGDSLWNIARQFHPAGIGENLYQFLISLHDLNREAFINGNISMLKADAQLHIPSARDIATINPGSAQKVFEQLWRAGVRSPDIAAGGDAPQFKSLNESDAPTQTAALAPTAKSPPGTEQQAKTIPASSPLLPAATGVIPASRDQLPPASVASTPAEPPNAPALAMVPRQITQGLPAASASSTDANPFLQKINESASAIQGLLEVRHQRLQALEQQILALQTQLQQAQTRAIELNQDAKATLEQRRDEVTRQAVQLGLLAAVLLILLGTALRYAVKWHLELRRRQGGDQ